MKHCKGCGQDKPLSEFHADIRKPNGVAHRCKKCANAGRRERFAVLKINPGLKQKRSKHKRAATEFKRNDPDIVTRACMCCRTEFNTDQDYRLCSRCRGGDRTRGYDNAYFCEAA